MGDVARPEEKRVKRKKHCKMKPAKGRTRECWVTMLRDVENNVDVVLGAPTKSECIKLFQRVSPGTAIIPKLVYNAVWREKKR